MKKRHNQYRNRITRAFGSTGMDISDKNKVKLILESMGAIHIKFDMFLGIQSWDRNGPTHGLFESMTKAVADQMLKIRHPDVICWYKNRLLIVEIDGDVHKGDLDYDDDYTALGIPYVKINKSYLKKEGITWAGWIDTVLQDVYD